MSGLQAWMLVIRHELAARLRITKIYVRAKDNRVQWFSIEYDGHDVRNHGTNNILDEEPTFIEEASFSSDMILNHIEICYDKVKIQNGGTRTMIVSFRVYAINTEGNIIKVIDAGRPESTKGTTITLPDEANPDMEGKKLIGFESYTDADAGRLYSLSAYMAPTSQLGLLPETYEESFLKTDRFGGPHGTSTNDVDYYFRNYKKNDNKYPRCTPGRSEAEGV